MLRLPCRLVREDRLFQEYKVDLSTGQRPLLGYVPPEIRLHLVLSRLVHNLQLCSQLWRIHTKGNTATV